MQVNLRNFCYYMVAPSLVYEPHFPRGKGFRPSYFIWKLISLASAMVGVAALCFYLKDISKSYYVLSFNFFKGFAVAVLLLC